MSQLAAKGQQNRTKAKVKALFKSIDAEKTGLIKEDAFFEILNLHEVSLEESQKSQLKKEFGQKKVGSILLIDYSAALASIGVDLGEAAIRDEVKWTTKDPSPAPKPRAPDATSLTSKALSKLGQVHKVKGTDLASIGEETKFKSYE